MPPERVQLASAVRACADRAAGAGTEAFEAELTRAGVGFAANRAATGRMSGYKFSSGRVDESGVPVWFKASQLDKTLAWSQLSKLLETAPAAEPVEVPGKGLLESRAKYQARVADAQAEAARTRAERTQAVHRACTERHAAATEAEKRARDLRREAERVIGNVALPRMGLVSSYDPAAYAAMAQRISPYGDGKAAGRIVEVLRRDLV